LKVEEEWSLRAPGIFTAIIIAVAGLFVYLSLKGEAGTRSSSNGTLISYSADAYAVESTLLLRGFSRSTGIPVAPVKSGGSYADANQITAGAPDDIFVSAALSATSPKYLRNLSSNWAIGFATDEMVLAYSNETLAQSVVRLGLAAEASNSSSDWSAFFSSIASGEVRVGIADPLSDPAGLRGWIVLEISGYLYADGNRSAYVAPLVRSGANVTGAHAAALVAPLESGQIQFLFMYRSAAIADGLKYVRLDRHVGLGDPTLAGFYSHFEFVDAAGITTGSPIVLCITVPLSSGNEAEAMRFVRYVVINTGGLGSFGLQPLSPSQLYNNTDSPASINQLASQGLIVETGGLQ
jgi:molybdate/tungstate transport system substrate-binding protein